MAERVLDVLICTSLTDAQLGRVRSASPRLRVSDGAALLMRDLPDSLRPGQKAAPIREAGQTLNELFSQAEVILAARRMPVDLAAKAPRLKWVQMPLAGLDATGVDRVPVASGIRITTAAGINALPVGEYAVMAMMMLVKNAKRLVHSHDAHRWDRFDLGLLRGKTLAVIGFGTVGREVARLAEPFGMKRLAVKRTVDPAEGLPPWVLPAEKLDEVLAQADIVTLCVPATPATKGMIGARQLGFMRPGAVLVNVARGDVVDDAALVAALQQEKLAGAALDVFTQEPLPPESPYWGLPNVLATGHVAGLFEGYDDAVVDLFVANLGHYLAREPLINEVDRRTGY